QAGITIDANPNPVVPSNDYIVSVAMIGGGAGPPQGLVQFYFNGSLYSTEKLNAQGQGRISVTAPSTEEDDILAAYYAGSDKYMPAQSINLTVQVRHEDPLRADLGFSPPNPVVSGPSGVFTLECVNFDGTHNAFTGPMDVAFYSEGWGASGRIVIASVNG